MQNTSDVSAVVKHVCLECVYIKNQWKISSVECKTRSVWMDSK